MSAMPEYLNRKPALVDYQAAFNAARADSQKYRNKESYPVWHAYEIGARDKLSDFVYDERRRVYPVIEDAEQKGIPCSTGLVEYCRQLEAQHIALRSW